jgi:hypothetical protein
VGHRFPDFIRRVKCPPFPPDLSPTDYAWSILDSIQLGQIKYFESLTKVDDQLL